MLYNVVVDFIFVCLCVCFSFEDNVEFVTLDACLKCYCVCGSWYNQTVASMKALTDKDEKVAAELREASDVYDQREKGEVIRWESDIGVTAMSRSGMRTEVAYWFLTIKQFKQRWLLDPSKMSDTRVKMVCIDDETGTKKLNGVLLRITESDPPHLYYRKVYLWHDTVWVKSEVVADPKDRLRAKQPQDVFVGLSKSMVAKREKAPLQNLEFQRGWFDFEDRF
jgi:hypothetical protein